MTTKERNGDAHQSYADDSITLNRVFVERIIKALHGIDWLETQVIIAQLQDKVETVKKKTQNKSARLRRETTGEDDYEVLTHIKKITAKWQLSNLL